jgi:predicted dehydrogenase
MELSRSEKLLRVGIIGAGLQARRRAPVFRDSLGGKLVVIAAAHLERAKQLAEAMGCKATDDWRRVTESDDIDVVLVCTPPHLHAPISIAAMENGKHVLCEKPLARTLEEAEEMVKVARRNNVKLKCGFNHRHHPSIRKAKELIDKGAIGELNFMRCTYGMCGRPGYEKEWRANPEIVGGGHLMEQGIHAIDLFRWFAGDFSQAVGFTATRYWKMAPLEDNAFALFKTSKGQIASLHSSLTQWKNLFSFEVHGQEGYIRINGLGGSYGTELIAVGKRAFFEPFKEEITEFRGEDRSWHEEWEEFAASIWEDREPMGNGRDGLEALRLVLAVYESAAMNQVVDLTHFHHRTI